MRQGPVLAEPKHSPSYPLEAEPVNYDRSFLTHGSCKQNLTHIINIINIESQTYRCVQETFMLSWWYLGSICEYNTTPSGKGEGAKLLILSMAIRIHSLLCIWKITALFAVLCVVVEGL